MPSSLSTLFQNCLIWCLLLIFLTVPILLLKIWKSFVILTSWILRPGAGLRSFKNSDIMTIGDKLYEKPLLNIGFILKIQSKINIIDFRSHFYKILLEPIDSNGTGRPVNGNLLCFFKRFWGYGFKQRLKLKDIDLEDLIYESNLRNGETFSDFTNRFFYSPYEEGKPLWNVALLHEVDPCGNPSNHEEVGFNGTTLLFRLHHSMGDGYSLIHLFEQLVEKTKTPATITRPIFSETIWDKIDLFLSVPSTMYEFGQKTSQILNLNPIPMTGNNTEVIYSYFTLDLESIKRVRRKTRVHVRSILFTLFGSVLRTILLEQKLNENNLPNYIFTAHSLPGPTHPRNKMCNDWTVGVFKVPIKNPNVLERLEETEQDYLEFQRKGIGKIIKSVLLPLMSLLPVTLLQKISDLETNVGTSWSAIVGGNDYKLLGHSIPHIWPFVGLTSPKMAVVTISLSHSQKLDVTLGINREFLSDAGAVNRITNELFSKELEDLVNISDRL